MTQPRQHGFCLLRNAPGARLLPPGGLALTVCVLLAAAAALLAGSAGVAQAAARAPSITAKAAAILDVPTGRFVYLVNADDRRAMASTTKIMTARVVLQSGIPLTKMLTVPSLELRWDETDVALKAGEKYTVDLLLRAMLVASAGDAARTLADGVAGSESAFVEQMNAEAAKLGLSDTHYATVSGMDHKGHYTTARDLTALAATEMTDTRFAKYVGSHSVTIRQPGSDPVTIPNTNRLLLADDWVTGIKTGYTGDAGYCLVASGVYRGRNMIVTVLGCATSDDRFSETAKLFEYGASLYTTWHSPKAGHVQATAEVPYSRMPLSLVLGERYSVAVPPGVKVAKTVTTPAKVKAPIAAGERLGKVAYSVAGERRHTTALVSDRDLPAPSWQTRLRARLQGLWRRTTHAIDLSLRRIADPRAILAPLF